jgi:hypothetical protein
MEAETSLLSEQGHISLVPLMYRRNKPTTAR